MKILGLSPHYDDLELGAYGTLQRMLHEEDVTAFRHITFGKPTGSEAAVIRAESKAVDNLLSKNTGIKILRTHKKYPTRRFNEYTNEIRELLYKVKTEFQPDLVFCPSSTDIHQDHSVIYAETRRVFKHVCILGYECSWNMFEASGSSSYMEISPEGAQLKADILGLFQSQKCLRVFLQEDNVLARLKANGVNINSPYAERFECIRWVTKL